MPDPLNTLPDNSPQPQQVFLPVTAEDFSRRKTRIVLACCGAGLIAAAIGGWMYKRTMDPIHAQESYDSGVKSLTIARYQQAILSFERSVELKPDFAAAYTQLGHALAAEGKSDRAVANFSKVIALRPGDPQSFLDRGAAYLMVKDNQAAIADATAAIRLDPKLAGAYDLRGVATRSMGEPQKALEDFNRAIELSPSSAFYYDRGATYQMLDEHRKAIADFNQVVAYTPDTAAGYFARAESRRAIGDTKGAQQDHLRGRILDGR